MRPGQENLKKYGSEKEPREEGRKGGINSGKTRRKKKKTKEILDILLSCDKPDHAIVQQLQREFPEAMEEVKTIDDLLNFSMIRQGIKGNVQAYNAIKDREEGKPKQPIVGGDDDDYPIRFFNDDQAKKILKRRGGSDQGSIKK